MGPGLILPSLIGGNKKFPSQLVAPIEAVAANETVLPEIVPTNELRRFFLL